MAEPSSLSTSRRRAPASAAIISVVVVRPRPKRPAATLVAGRSARVMRRSPVLWRPWSALVTSRHRHGRAFALAPAGHPGLRGHHQRRRNRPSTRVASGDARGRPQRSHCAAIAGLAAPLVGPPGIATAAPSPSLLRSRPDRSGLRDHCQRRREGSTQRQALRMRTREQNKSNVTRSHVN